MYGAIPTTVLVGRDVVNPTAQDHPRRNLTNTKDEDRKDVLSMSKREYQGITRKTIER